jgi:hypothetical protein
MALKSGSRMRTIKVFAAGAAALAMTAGAMAGQATTITNGPDGELQSSFGYDDSQTYGEVFAAPEGGKLNSFTMYLSGPIGGQLYGGVAEWNGTDAFGLHFGAGSTLFESAAVNANHGGAYTFAPNVDVLAGHLYVAYLSVFGLDHTGQGKTSMPLAGDDVIADGEYFKYFVWNNESGDGHGPHDDSWNYFFNAGNARLDATFNSVPEPATWAMMIAGFGLAGAALRRRRAATA